MAKTVTAGKIGIKKIITVIITLAVIVSGVFLVKRLAEEKEKSDELREQKIAADAAAKEKEEKQKQYGNVRKTTADTDTTRRYGYDVLYANHGLRVMLIESKLFIDEPELTLDVINESDEKMSISAEYVSVNGLCQWPEFECETEPGQTVTEKMIFRSAKMSEINIKRLRICFSVSSEDLSISEYSKPIIVDYDNARDENWIAPSDCSTVYESEMYTLSALPVEYEIESPRNYYRSAIYLKNYKNPDLVISMTGYRLYDKNGNEIDEDLHNASFYSFMPGKTLTNRYLKMRISDKIKRSDLGKIVVDAEIYPRNEEDADKVNRESVTFTVNFDNMSLLVED